jgi:hypothetical protein
VACALSFQATFPQKDRMLEVLLQIAGWVVAAFTAWQLYKARTRPLRDQVFAMQLRFSEEYLRAAIDVHIAAVGAEQERETGNAERREAIQRRSIESLQHLHKLSFVAVGLLPSETSDRLTAYNRAVGDALLSDPSQDLGSADPSPSRTAVAYTLLIAAIRHDLGIGAISDEVRQALNRSWTVGIEVKP